MGFNFRIDVLMKVISAICCFAALVLMDIQQDNRFGGSSGYYFAVQNYLYYDQSREVYELAVSSVGGFLLINLVLLVALLNTGTSELMNMLFMVVGAVMCIVTGILNIIYAMDTKTKYFLRGFTATYVLESAVCTFAAGVSMLIDFIISVLTKFK